MGHGITISFLQKNDFGQNCQLREYCTQLTIHYSIVTLTFYLLTQTVKRSSLSHCCKFGENVSNTLQDIVLTMFRDAHTDARTDGRI